MELNDDYRNFAKGFARAVIARDFVSAHQMLAPWLQQSITPEILEQMIEAEVRETAEVNGLEGEFHPGSYEIDWNSSSLEDLQAPPSYGEGRRIAPEVTAENFRQWMVIQFQPSEEEGLDIDAYMDMWMAVVELKGEYKVGHFEMEDPD